MVDGIAEHEGRNSDFCYEMLSFSTVFFYFCLTI